MSIAYLTYFHRRNLPQVQCLIASIRRFDSDSEIITVVEDECLPDCKFLVQDGIMILRMSYAEEHCREYGLDWGSVRGSRSERDTAWTFQACYPYWWLQELSVDGIVYVDSDCFFFQDIRPYIDRLPETAHVALCPHHYPPGRENKSAGVFNNGVMWWRNSDVAREIAFDWGKEAIARFEPHEQILLDAWPERYGEAVAEFERGVDCGPWQLPTIIPSPKDDSPLLITGECGPIHIKGGTGKVSIGGIELGKVTSWQADSDGGWQTVPLQSMHFHEFRIDATGNNPVTIKGRQCNRTNYPIHPSTVEAIYLPYEQALAAYI